MRLEEDQEAVFGKWDDKIYSSTLGEYWNLGD